MPDALPDAHPRRRENARRRWLATRRPWDRRFRLFDFIAALALGLALDWLLLAHRADWADALATKRSAALFTAGAAVTGVLLGLTLTSLAILADYIAELTEASDHAQTGRPATLADPPDGVLVLKERHVNQLVGAFINTTAALGAATVLALAGLVPSGADAIKGVLAAWLVVTVIAIVGVARCTSLLGIVVRGIIQRRARQKPATTML